MSATPALQGDWPYHREQPDLVVLGPLPGAVPSGAPPVRIFLGTEEGQHRAERVFVYSVARHRDPGRTYEIHLMKNLAGFDRRGWRTGFTLYRFAIPDLAGRSGRAIYNDVDQVYLADPALLFDLDLGSHGYLAISAKDTSVMLIGCERMLPWWSRAAASSGRKGGLTNRPAGTPGLWGRLDPHWNARDLEYIEGRTKCLHYTALHQQPWNPFPEQYSYHPNPLAYIWHELERQADGEGFQVFALARPSPGFLALAAAGGDRPAAAGPSPQPSAAALRLLGQGSTALLVTLGGAPVPALGAAEVRRLDLAREPADWPEGPFDTVVLRDLFERLPPADIAWVLDEGFGRARSAVLVQVRAQAADGLGSPDWWRRRVAEAAARRPGVSWQLDAEAPDAAVSSVGLRRVDPPESPRVWVLTGAGEEGDRQARRLAAALGWPHEERRIAYAGRRSRLPNALLGASLANVDAAASDPLEPPWPDLVIAAGERSVPVAQWVRAKSGDRARLVQLGRPAAPFEVFDLIIATPEQRLPIRGNVLQLAAPLPAGGDDEAPSPPGLAGLPRPLTALLVAAPERPYALGPAQARELAAAATRDGGGVAAWLDPRLPPEAAEAARSALAGRAEIVTDAEAPRLLTAAADRVVLPGGAPGLLADACVAGRPVLLLELPRESGGPALLRPLERALAMAVGGSTYRGTPMQQHLPGRMLDWLVTRGLVHRPRDLEQLHRSLEARGLLTRVGAPEPVASPRPLDDLARSVERVRRLLHERPLRAG